MKGFIRFKILASKTELIITRENLNKFMIEGTSKPTQAYRRVKITPVNILKIEGPLVTNSLNLVKLDPSDIPDTVTEIDLKDVILKSSGKVTLPHLSKLNLVRVTFPEWIDFTCFFDTKNIEELRMSYCKLHSIPKDTDAPLPSCKAKIDYFYFNQKDDPEKNQQLINVLQANNIVKIYFPTTAISIATQLFHLFPAKTSIELEEYHRGGRSAFAISFSLNVALSYYLSKDTHFQIGLANDFLKLTMASSEERLSTLKTRYPRLSSVHSLSSFKSFNNLTEYSKAEIKIDDKTSQIRLLFSKPLAPFFAWDTPALAPEREKIITFYCCLQLLEDALTASLDKLRKSAVVKGDSPYTAAVEDALILRILFEYDGVKVGRLSVDKKLILPNDTSQQSAVPSQSPAQITLPSAADHSSQDNV